MVEEKIEMPNWSTCACFDCAEGSPLSPFFPERFEDVDVSVLLTCACMDYFEDQVRHWVLCWGEYKDKIEYCTDSIHRQQSRKAIQVREPYFFRTSHNVFNEALKVSHLYYNMEN